MNEFKCVCVYGVRKKRIIVDSGSIHDAFIRDPCAEVARLIFSQLLKIETK